MTVSSWVCGWLGVWMFRISRAETIKLNGCLFRRSYYHDNLFIHNSFAFTSSVQIHLFRRRFDFFTFFSFRPSVYLFCLFTLIHKSVIGCIFFIPRVSRRILYKIVPRRRRLETPEEGSWIHGYFEQGLLHFCLLSLSSR